MILSWEILEKTLWSGVVGLGFAVLFNVPKRLLLSIFITGLAAGFIKFVCLTNHINIILASLWAATLVGFVTIPIARFKHTSPFVISIPSVIGMIPGYFGYQTLLGIMRLGLHRNTTDDITSLLFITHNALNMLFILGSLAIGVALPWLLFREKGLKKIHLTGDDNIF
jgi:uncharacterized membrane protein YjjB (DUF3815 family)